MFIYLFIIGKWYNISRSSESEFLKNVSEQNETVESPEQKFPQEQIEQHQEQAEPLLAPSCQGLQGTLPPSEGQGLAEERISNIEDLTEKAYTAETTLAASLTSVIEKMPNSNGNDSAISSYLNASAPLNNKGWFKRKRLADFHPLTEEDADLLQLRSNREFNLNFINKLLLKLAEQYPNHYFCNKKVLLNYMVKALAHELRASSKVNQSSFQFKSNDPEKLKEQYLEKIERNLDTSKQAQLKRKIAGIFEANTAYELLTSCEFKGVDQDQYQLKLLKDISVSEHMKTKILEQVQAVYGNKIKQLQILPFKPVAAAKQEIKDLSGLNKLDPASVWYKVRRFLLQEHGQNADRSIFSKLAVVEEDKVASQVILIPFPYYK
ncbi:hypothetical protein [Candidatus Tisiphia endosymbiont of Beris chalybata]|uniref:hypothetical protein n=1 Tax=Candidatus Tisiphia endosymbiont of Beris chalybata TaxID=3066262 RepID=UPI00312CB430